jgi:hypothetical protein
MLANLTPPKPRSGRPRLTNRKLDERLRHYLLRYPFKTAKELKAEVIGWQIVSVRIIQKVYMVRLGLPSCCAAKKVSAYGQDGQKTAQFLLNESEMDWETVMFNDESTFCLINPKVQKVRRSSLTSRYKQRYTIRNVKHLASVMVWGCFSGLGGRGSPYFLTPKVTMNSNRYIAMLKDKLLFWMTHHRAKHFLPDGAPCHTSREEVMAFLKKNKCSGQEKPDS